MQNTTQNLKKEMTTELHNLLNYWSKNTNDTVNNGFIGQIDWEENKNFEAEKGAVMHARILWTFSAAYPITTDPTHKNIAKKAFEIIIDQFYDKEYGGIFWSITPNGTPKDTKNQIYALAFVIYGLSEYFAISQDNKALETAIDLYKIIQKYSYDPINKGYLEAFTRDWKEIDDLRLSEKDANEKKTMNTHLHIIEGYANLYKVWKNPALLKDITELLEVIDTHFMNTKTGHLHLFFNEIWIEKTDVISYGHDIEAAWLLLQCAEISENKTLIERYKQHAIQITNATIESGKNVISHMGLPPMCYL